LDRTCLPTPPLTSASLFHIVARRHAGLRLGDIDRLIGSLRQEIQIGKNCLCRMVNTEVKIDRNFSDKIIIHPETLGQQPGRADFSAQHNHAKLVAVIVARCTELKQGFEQHCTNIVVHLFARCMAFPCPWFE